MCDGLAPAAGRDGADPVLVLGGWVQPGQVDGRVRGVHLQMLAPRRLLHVAVGDSHLLVAQHIVQHATVGVLGPVPRDQQARRRHLRRLQVAHATRPCACARRHRRK